MKRIFQTHLRASRVLYFAANDLLTACLEADKREELPANIDGLILDAVVQAMAETEAAESALQGHLPNKLYTFDDACIGVTTDGNRTVTNPMIQRPAGSETGGWYKFAEQVVTLLNLKEAEYNVAGCNGDAEAACRVTTLKEQRDNTVLL